MEETRALVEMADEELIDTLESLVFGSYGRTTPKERYAVSRAIDIIKNFKYFETGIPNEVLESNEVSTIKSQQETWIRLSDTSKAPVTSNDIFPKFCCGDCGNCHALYISNVVKDSTAKFLCTVYNKELHQQINTDGSIRFPQVYMFKG